MIDIHCHILPATDDGAKNLEQSLKMARLLTEAGFKKVVVTPHIMEKSNYKFTREEILQRMNALQSELTAKKIELELALGAEYYLDQPIAELLVKNYPLCHIANSFYIMIEMPVLYLPSYLAFRTLSLKIDNPELKKEIPFLKLIIAHPERNEEMIKNPQRIRELKDQGFSIQLNLGSIVGLYGKQVRKAAEKMLKYKLVDLVGTDAHSPEQLEEFLKAGLARLKHLAGKRGMEILLRENPERVVANESLEPFY